VFYRGLGALGLDIVSGPDLIARVGVRAFV
jgi:hypothetical protein